MPGVSTPLAMLEGVDQLYAKGAEIDGPAGLAFDQNGNLYVVDHANNRVRKIDTSGVITTVIGSGGPVETNRGSYAGDGEQAIRARLQEPIGLVIAPDHTFYIADRNYDRIRKVGENGVITTLAGNGARGFPGDGGPARQAALDEPETMVIDKRGNLYVSVTAASAFARSTQTV